MAQIQPKEKQKKVKTQPEPILEFQNIARSIPKSGQNLAKKKP